MPFFTGINTFNQVYDDVIAAFDNSRQLDLPRINCVDDDGYPYFGTDLNGVWNCNRCDNDRAYYIPAPALDTAWEMVQFQEPDYVSDDATFPNAGWYGLDPFLCKFYIGDCANGNAVTWNLLDVDGNNIDGWNTWADDLARNVQALRFIPFRMYERLLAIDPAASCCFMFKFEFYDALGAVRKTFYSEQYTVPTCHEKLVYVSALEKADCSKDWFGDVIKSNYIGTDAFAFYNAAMLRAQYYRNGYAYEREDNERDRAYYTQKRGLYMLKGSPLPPFVTDKLDKIYPANEMMIQPYAWNGFVWKPMPLAGAYRYDAGLEKTIEYNSMWRFQHKFKDFVCEVNFGCDD